MSFFRRNLKKPRSTAVLIPPYVPSAINFDGTNDYMLRGGVLTGLSDGKSGTVSFWIKFNDDVETFETIFIGNYPAGGAPELGLAIYRQAQGRMFIDGYNSSGTRILASKTLPGGAFAFVVANGWMHFMASWNLATGTVQMYINGNDASDTEGQIITNDTIDYTQNEWAIGAFQDGTSKLNACIADIYINLLTQIDLSDSLNREKFIFNGNPVYLGLDGSNPNGTSPIIYFTSPFFIFQNNKGIGGDFSVNGSLTACSDAP